MDITFYCYLSVPGMEAGKRKAFLSEFVSDISDYLRVLGNRFLILSEFVDDCLKPEPNNLLTEFGSGSTLIIPFRFQYKRLQQAYLRVELLKTSLLNLCYEKRVVCDFEYHLENYD